MGRTLVRIEGRKAFKVYANNAKREMVSVALFFGNGIHPQTTFWMSVKDWRSFYRRWDSTGGMRVLDLTGREKEERVIDQLAR